MRISNPEKMFEETKEKDPKFAAEIAYAIAMLAKANGDEVKAIRYGMESIGLLDKLDTTDFPHLG